MKFKVGDRVKLVIKKTHTDSLSFDEVYIVNDILDEIITIKGIHYFANRFRLYTPLEELL